jgi:uncharacterized cupredoxin-like copper-binding protein
VRVALVAALGALLLAAADTDWSKADTVTMVQRDYAFDPSNLTFRVGTPYRLHVENQGKENHEITAPTFFKSVALKNPEVLNSERTEILLRPGEQSDIYFVAKQPGRYPFTCADHDWAGMTGLIVVQ